jgi:hypothetical protein
VSRFGRLGRVVVSEAYRCYVSGSARGAIVLTWTALCADLIAKAQIFYEEGENAAKDLVAKVEQAQGSAEAEAIPIVLSLERRTVPSAPRTRRRQVVRGGCETPGRASVGGLVMSWCHIPAPAHSASADRARADGWEVPRREACGAAVLRGLLGAAAGRRAAVGVRLFVSAPRKAAGLGRGRSVVAVDPAAGGLLPPPTARGSRRTATPPYARRWSPRAGSSRRPPGPRSPAPIPPESACGGAQAYEPGRPPQRPPGAFPGPPETRN